MLRMRDICDATNRKGHWRDAMVRPYGIATTILLLLVAAQGLAAQRPALPRDMARIGTATLHWYAKHAAEDLRREGKTLVISQAASERVIESDGIAGTARSTRFSFGFTRSALRAVERRAGVNVETCSRLQAGSLCNVAKPFTWLVLSVPLVERDTAVLFLRAMEPFPNAPDVARTLQGTGYRLDLVQKGGDWLVTNWRVTGVH